MSSAGSSSGRSLNDRVRSILPRLSYKMALDQRSREAIFRIRHDAYLREGAISSQPDGLFKDEVDDAQNTYLFGVHIDGVLMSSIRLSVATVAEPDIPTAHVFPDLLDGEIQAGKIVVDPTRFVVDHSKSRLHPELPYLTLRTAWLAMEYFQADILLAAVRPEHASFYKRFWNTRCVTEPRSYPLLSKPITLTMSDYAASRELVELRYPFLASTQAERERVFGRIPAHAGRKVERAPAGAPERFALAS